MTTDRTPGHEVRDFEAALRADWDREDHEQAERLSSPATPPEPAAVRRRRRGLADHLDKDDLPRERLIREGADKLSNAELVAILLSTGDGDLNVLEKSRQLLAERGLVGLLRADVQELMSETGLGPAKVTRIKAAIQLAARGLADDEWPARAPFVTADQVFRRYQGLLGDLLYEEVWILVLDKQHCLIREERLYKGMVDGASVRVAEMLRPVILHQGRSMIVVHNHPSGNPEPSRADRLLTTELVEAAQTMAIEFVDHIIVTRSNFVSMASLGFIQQSEAQQGAADETVARYRA